jgi:hypothetical protein
MAQARWRAQNAALLEARKVHHEPKACSECDRAFVPRRIDTLVCGEVCRWKRDRKLRKAAAALREPVGAEDGWWCPLDGLDVGGCLV